MELSFPLAIKSLEEAGTFTGLASTYGNTDHAGDVVEAGAFRDTLQKRGAEIPILWCHDQRSPVGLGKLTDSPQGLIVAGAIDLDTTVGRETHSGLRKGYVRGLSIGYQLPPGGASMRDGIRYLKQVELIEVSLCPLPTNERARVTSVKSVASVRDFERFLHEAGWSKSEATKLASYGWKGLAIEEPARDPDAALLEWLRANAA